MGLSSAGEAVALAAVLAARYVSLHTADPGNTGASEASGTGYARVAAGTFTVSGGNPSTANNDAAVDFPVAGGSWGTITHYGIWSAVSGGTFLGGEALAASKAISLSDIVRFPAGSLQMTGN